MRVPNRSFLIRLFLIALAAFAMFAAPQLVPRLHGFLPLAFTVHAQSSEKPAQSPAAEKTAGEAFKNVQVLKDVPQSQFMPAMFVITESLGVVCSHCHVTSDTGPWPLEKDDKDTKKTARKMMQMVQAINEQNFGGRPEVNCATCHQGHSKPVSAAPILPLGTKRPAAEQDAKNLPPADEILDKYVAALGGAGALDRIHTRSVKGTLLGEFGRIYPLEIIEKAPGEGLITIIFPDGSTQREAFDGTDAWNESDGHAFTQSGLERAKIVRDMQFFIGANFKAQYPRRVVSGKETVADEDTWEVRVSGAGNVSEKLYFSIKTGLLLRRNIAAATALGPFTEETDYADYREVDGVRLPFTIRRMEINTRYTESYAEIKHNVPVDDALFHKPAGAN